MKLSDRAKKIARATVIATAIAAPAEGLRQVAYYDPIGVLTVCYGSTTDVVKNKFYPLEQCKLRLNNEMRAAVEAVDRCVPGLPEKVLAAFGDAGFNVGERIACDKRSSTAARKLAAGDLVGACKELPRWNKARVAGVMVPLPGLTKRRNKEMQICLEGAA